MKRSKQRRAGATETFSVSVDLETKRALRRLADKQYGGNLSALVTDLAEEARRRLSSGAYLERQSIARLDGPEVAQLEATIAQEISSQSGSGARSVSASKVRRGRRVA